MKSITLHVTGMTCGGCVKSGTQECQKNLMVQKKAVVTLDDGKAVVTFDEKCGQYSTIN